MSEEKEIEEVKEVKRDWRRRFSHRWIVRNVPFFLFLSLIAVIYIYNGHNADKTIRNINKVSKQLKELQYEYKTLKGEVMFMSKQSEIVNAVRPFGLNVLMRPPFYIADTVQK